MNTIHKIREMCLVYKLTGFKMEENNFMKRNAQCIYCKEYMCN